ncbi:glycosyltransferase [Gephyromycinifex aptenodytis]|uniref:glycosyltransferase n=1 Tax=Gephyromycinifex aptenodytis TaxID=2716227 RepID=UPI0014465EF1|nr:glycosyltransferase [Gephyromycinifex aptenodytis]
MSDTTARVSAAASKKARALVGPQSPLRAAMPESVRRRIPGARRRLPTRIVAAIDQLSGQNSSVSRSLLAAAAKRPEVPSSPVRLWVGPANFAGQGWLWAHSVERHVEGVQARAMAVRGPLRFRVDYEVDPDVYRHIEWQRAQEAYVTGNYTHALIEAERPLFGPLYGRTCEGEIARLKAAGMQVALISHGSDLRIPSKHVELHPSSPFRITGDEEADKVTRVLQARAEKNAAILADFAAAGGQTFVSTPDLLDYAPNATWVPGVVDSNLWASDWPVMARRRPRVVHVPSNGRLKGSELVDPILRQLDAQGVIEYQSLRQLSHPEIRRCYQEADIVLDQFVMGLYGVAAVEALAAGRIVIAYVGDTVRARVREASGLEVPIVEATPETVAEVIRDLVENPERAREIAARGPEFVRALHDGTFSAKVLSAFTGGELARTSEVEPWSPPPTLPMRPEPDRDAPIRLWVGPSNFAGQGHAWAQAAQAHVDGVSARSMGVRRRERLLFPTDYEIEPHPYNRMPVWCMRQERYLIDLYTHVLIEAARPVTGRVPAARSEAEEDTMREAGLHLAHIVHGTEVRVPSIHQETTPWSPFHDTTWDLIPTYEQNARAVVARLRRFDGPVFVSTPDLLDMLPDATWCPVVVDPQKWALEGQILQRERPVVVHAPSSGRIKGSTLIDPLMERLDAEGVIEYRRLRDMLPSQMPLAYRDADIVLDQFALGSYGVAACEAMAAGRVVLGHNTDSVRERVQTGTGMELPIVEATPESIVEVLRGLLADRDGARARAEAGRQFVAQVHDGRRSADALRGFLTS